MADKPLLYVTVQKNTEEALLRQLEQLRLTPRRRFELAREAANEVKKFSGARARKQESLTGGRMEPRSTKRSRYRKSKDDKWKQKRKMFTALGRAGNMATYRDGEMVVTSWKKGTAAHGWANLAWGHHYGMEIPITRDDVKKASANRKQDRPATRRMADALLRHGYRQPYRAKNGKIKLRRISNAQIRKCMKQKQAAWLLRLLVHGDADRPKASSWVVRIPARPFLGVDGEQSKQLLDRMAEKIVAELNK